MTENKLPIRKSPRLEGYNYAQEGAYFITICVQNRLRLFGTVEEQELYLNDAGNMVGEWWQRIPNKYPDFDIDLFVVMPNHFHGIFLSGMKRILLFRLLWVGLNQSHSKHTLNK